MMKNCSQQLLVSIGIPVYNVESFIEKCIVSVFNQSYQNLEILIIDDCGQDKSMDIVYRLQNNHPCGSFIKVVKQPNNRGLGEARNAAIKSATGKYIFFLDSDDYIEPNTIELMLEEAEKNSSDVVLASMRCVNYETGEVTPAFTYESHKVIDGKDAFANLVCANLRWNVTVTSTNILFSMDFLKKNNLLFSIRTSEDSLFLSDYYSCVNTAILLPNITYNYVIHKGSLMGYEIRDVIPVWQIRERFKGDAIMTERSRRLKNRSFYDVHCARVMKHKFRAVCVALRHRNRFSERLTDKEIAADLKHPASLGEILRFKRYLLFNLCFYVLGSLPSPISIMGAKLIGKVLHWI